MNGDSYFCDENAAEVSLARPARSTRQSLRNRFEEEEEKKCGEGKAQEMRGDAIQQTQSFASWCDSFSSSLPAVNPRRALRSGAEKLSQTLNTVKTTFDTLSQKLRKSTRRRQPLKNIESPKTPVTPYTRSRNVLGRTPTKLYSPFTIETPGKENNRRRSSGKRLTPPKPSRMALKKKAKGTPSAMIDNSASYSPEMKFSRDLVQTQIGIYEFQSTANRIIQSKAKE